jgi:hypothetical protein
MRMLRIIGEKAHLALSVLAVACVVPAFMAAGLPLNFDWPHFLKTFWLGLTIQSAFFACLLYVVGFPWGETLQPVWDRYRRQKARILILALLYAQLYYLFGWMGLLFLSLVTVAILELAERTRDRPGAFGQALASFLLPAVYWFIGLVLVFSLNQAVIALRPHQTNDALLNRMDAWVLAGSTVSDVAHRAYGLLPLGVFQFLDLLYFAMFAQVGAGVILIGLRVGRRRAFQFVSTVVTAGYVSLIIYYLWPSLSPFYSCPTHFDVLPRTLRSFPIQQQLLSYATALREHTPFERVGAGYFIAFPCMHIAAPTIALWFLRGWRRVAITLLVLDVFLCFAIVLLEYHYVMDLVGGVAVAALAILMADPPNSPPRRLRHDS